MNIYKLLRILLKNTLETFIFVEVPENRPIIHGIKQRYQVGDSLRANCTSKNSKPAANLTWTINDMPVFIYSIHFYKLHQFHNE